VKISTQDLRILPDVKRLKAAFQSMAILDAIISPEWEYRYYSFEDGLNDGAISIGSMRNGSGDDLNAIFGRAGCLIRGFAHEYPMSPYANDPPKVFPGVLDDIPPEFAECKAAMHADWWNDVTFCVWRRHSDAIWHHGKIDFAGFRHDDGSEFLNPDGSEFLLSPFDGLPETYHAWAEEYYEPSKFSLATVRQVFEHRPLMADVVRALNAERVLEELADEIRQVGYPQSNL
jgi:hypothetical protein